MLKMVFTVYCAALLYIEANGGGTHITNINHLQLLTKVSHARLTSNFFSEFTNMNSG